MTPVDLLIETGELLHGKHWTGSLSDDLGVSDSTVRYWVRGKMPLPPDHPILDKLADLVDLRLAALIHLKQKFLNPGDENVVTLASNKSSQRP